ncbi:bacterio-opsin activator domain-containing protein [Natrinema limicola]|uniref:PAS sensor protein n=1 Tax=Natrinema limicola JCM 13563 TaxID=1230457 RepID=M0CFB9_9EURY|nr:bacterio-opsin activator domain-containing protein [Natrinema limicola]ELZ21353.1 PAS sensor protein [Natrinema limicola JCM 13563]
MVHSLEDAETTPGCVLVGTSEWIRTATAELAAEAVTVAGVVSAASDLTDDRLETATCVLTDERAALAAVDGACPTVYAIDSTADEAIDDLRAEGATEIVVKRSVQKPRLLAHRLQRTLAAADCERERALTDQHRYRAALDALSDATSHILAVDSETAACESLIDIVADVLEIDGVVYRFDDRATELRPVAHSAAYESTVGSPAAVEPNGSSIWETFVTGDPSTADDIATSPAAPDATAAQSGLAVSLGEHGVFVAVSSAPDADVSGAIELVKPFVAATETTLDRIGQRQRRHDCERDLERQTRRLERLDAALETRRDIEQSLLTADSRTELERGVLARLTKCDACSLAWFGEPDANGNSLEPRAHAGHDRGYLDAVPVPTVDESTAEPAGRAARAKAPVYVENVAASVHDGAWRGEALSRNVLCVYAVPLVYDGFLYGVLSIYGDQRDAFDEPFRSMLADLSETIAYAIDAVTRTHALSDVGRTEVELEVAADATLCRLAAFLDERVRYAGVTTRDDETQVVFAAVDGPLETEAHAPVDGISQVVTVAEHEDETVLQLRLTEPSLGAITDAHGAQLREFVADTTGGRARIDIPDAVDVRDLIAGLSQNGPDVSMVARRAVATDSCSMAANHARSAVLETVTDRQREVIQTAYHSGFFEWPRHANGEEIADSLEISSPAFHKHVRAVERKLFAVLFEGATASEVN